MNTRGTRQLAGALVAVFLSTIAGRSQAAGRAFYDGFESGNTNQWGQDGNHNRCQVVPSAEDGVAGPYSGTRMARCDANGVVAWNDPAAFETLVLESVPHTDELFFRVRVRLDNNFEKTGGSAAKILRIFATATTYNDLFETAYDAQGFRNEGVANNNQLVTYWGESGDTTSTTASWHKIEYYINKATGKIRVWHDGVMRRDDTRNLDSSNWLPIHLRSNWSDPHDATNYVYFDEFEAFSDTGADAVGLMSDATVAATGADGGAPNGSDGGTVVDGGTGHDGGAAVDGGAREAGGQPAVDGGSPSNGGPQAVPDSGIAPSKTGETPATDHGCSCGVQSQTAGDMWPLLGAMAVWFQRRRRRS